MNVAIDGIGIAFPRRTISRDTLVAAGLDVPAGWHSSRVPEPDEDALTLAVAAARRVEVDGLASFGLASTSLPYTERVQSGLVVEALGCPRGVLVTEHTTSDRAGTEALAAHAAQVTAGGGRAVVVAASAGPSGIPTVDHSAGAVAVSLAPHGDVATVDAFAHAVAEQPGLGYVPRGGTDRQDIGVPDYEAANVVGLVRDALSALDGVTRPSVAVIAGVSGGVARKVAAVLDDPGEVVVTYTRFGDLGSVAALAGMATALGAASPGDPVLVVSVGAGSAVDVVALTAGEGCGRAAIGDPPSGELDLGAFVRLQEER